MKILFVCTSNKDRSPALEEYFKATQPENEYRSAGINEYFCKKKGTHLIIEDDLIWADLVIYAEDIHKKIIQEKIISPSTSFPPSTYVHKYLILNCGEYKQGCIGDDYILKAEEKVKTFMENL